MAISAKIELLQLNPITMNNQLAVKVALLLTAICCFMGVWLYVLFTPVIPPGKGYIFDLKPGTSGQTFIAELSQQGIVQHPKLFALYVFLQRGARPKTGEYLFREGSSLYSIWKQVDAGTGLYNHHFTIIPGWSFAQLREALARANGLRHFTATLDEKQIMSYLGRADLAPEGEFFPETYYYTRDMQDIVILKRAYDLMQNRLNEAWQNRATNLPYKTAYEALITASLIEKEAYLNAERPIIAGVIMNRLQKNMLLQIDPTVIYGMGTRYTGKIHRSDLLDNTIYNTYLHKGLPPTPIAMPSMPSINAALHPQQNSYIYYVAKGNGGHQFSTTLIEHNVAVEASYKIRNGGSYVNDPLLRQHVKIFMEQNYGASQIH